MFILLLLAAFVALSIAVFVIWLFVIVLILVVKLFVIGAVAYAIYTIYKHLTKENANA